MLPVRDCSVEVLLQVWCNPPWHYCSQTWLWIVLWFLEWIYDAWSQGTSKRKYYFKKKNFEMNCLPANSQTFCRCSPVNPLSLWLLTHLLCSFLSAASRQHPSFLNLHQKLLSVLDEMLCVGIGISKNNEWSQHYIKRTPEEQLKHSLSTTKLGIAALECISLRLSLLLACYCIVII